jgi:hypothetical protein
MDIARASRPVDSSVRDMLERHEEKIGEQLRTIQERHEENIAQKLGAFQQVLERSEKAAADQRLADAEERRQEQKALVHNVVEQFTAAKRRRLEGRSTFPPPSPQPEDEQTSEATERRASTPLPTSMPFNEASLSPHSTCDPCPPCSPAGGSIVDATHAPIIAGRQEEDSQGLVSGANKGRDGHTISSDGSGDVVAHMVAANGEDVGDAADTDTDRSC